MAKFITGDELNSEIGKIISNANETLILISPFIKLHDRLKSTLSEKKENHELNITVVFGKNEHDTSKSISIEDVNFLKQLPNIQIRYEKRLHAKYYANENAAILTSMNLYSYSQDNNIEAGVLIKPSIMGNIANNIVSNITDENSFDKQTHNYFDVVIKQSQVIFNKVPQIEKTFLGLKRNYKEPLIEDHTSDFFQNRQKQTTYYTASVKDSIEQQKITGFCIRTGERIPFNVKKPLSAEAYKSWSKYNNPNFPEKFCHFSGEPSNKETSLANPILSKNLKKAQEAFG